jgi:pimeloyl-ACP methyl ester carboxylesterase
LLLAFFYGFVPWFLTDIATSSRFHFPDPNDRNTPQSFGLAFSSVEFRSGDGILLKGWYIPATPPAREKPRGTIVYCHGHNRTRVEMLPEAVFAHGLGYSGLLFDLRHQGQSGGAVSTVGYQERLDAVAAVHYALDQERAERPIILWGVSMGAAAALLAAAESPEVSAVISDSTFLTFSDTIRHHYYLFRSFARRRWWWFPPLPAFPITDEVIYWAAWKGHFRPADFDMEQAVKRINPRPILFVGVQGDQRMPPAIAQKLYAEATSPQKGIVIVPGSRHGEGFKQATEQYEKAVSGFLVRLQRN